MVAVARDETANPCALQAFGRTYLSAAFIASFWGFVLAALNGKSKNESGPPRTRGDVHQRNSFSEPVSERTQFAGPASPTPSMVSDERSRSGIEVS